MAQSFVAYTVDIETNFLHYSYDTNENYRRVIKSTNNLFGNCYFVA